MNSIIEILGFAAIGHLTTDFISSFELPRLPDKPFRCDMCMTFWIALIPMIVLHGFHGILMAGISSILANYIYKWV